MGNIKEIVSNAIEYMTTAQISDIIDIILVAMLIYVAIGLIRRTNTTRLARGIVIILLALWLSDLFKFRMINSLLKTTVELGFIALVIIFQPELRRLLERMGSGRFMFFLGGSSAPLARYAAAESPPFPAPTTITSYLRMLFLLFNVGGYTSLITV